MSDIIDSASPFPYVSLAAWRERAEAGRPLREKPLLEGPVVRVLHTERPAEDRGRPGASPFVRGSTPHAGVQLGFEVRGARNVLARLAAAAAAGAERIRVGPRACASLAETELPKLWDAAGSSALTLLPGADAIAWSLLAPETVRVADDPLATLAKTGRLPCDGTSVLRRSAERTAAVAGRTLEIDTRPYHQAGASPSTEIALAVGSGLTLLRALVDAGHPLADGPRRMTFTFSLDADVFLGIASLRAARWVWSKVLRALGIDGPEQGMYIHASSSIRSESRLEPMNNALRGTTSAFAAFAGGANEISVSPYDDVTGAPSPEADRLALTTLHLLRWESHLGRVTDPGGGSYHVETLTSALAREAWSELQEIEHHGGVLRGLLDGSIQDRVAQTAAARSQAAVTRRRGIIGVSRYASPQPPSTAVSGDAAQAEDVTEGETLGYSELRAMKDSSFDALRRALLGPDAARAEPLPTQRLSEPFETLREQAGATPLDVLLLAVGPPAGTRARTDFARDALGVAGMRCDVLAAKDLDEAVAELEELSPHLVCLAAPDDALAELVPALLEVIGAPLVVAAAPDDALAGVTAFVHLKMNVIETLEHVLAAVAPSEEASS